MLVQDIVKFFIFLVILAAAGSALETDICNYYPDNADNLGVECDPIGDYYD